MSLFPPLHAFRSVSFACVLATFLTTSCRRDSSAPVSAAETSNSVSVGDLPDAIASPLVAGDDAGTAEVVAQIVVRSKLVDAKKADYKDCLFTADLSILTPLSGEKTPRHVVAFFPGFLDRKLQPEADLKLGDLIRVRLQKYEDMPQAVRDMARSDEVEDFELSRWFAVATVKIDKSSADFASPPSGSFLDESAVAAPEVKPVKWPRSARAAETRREQMAADKRRIAEALERNGGSWAKWVEKLGPFHAELQARVDAPPAGHAREGKHYFEVIEEDAYAKLCERGEQRKPGPLAMLQNLNMQLRQRGIDLIVAPVPRKEVVHADRFSDLAPADGIYLANRQRFLKQLLDADVEVIDFVPGYQKARDQHQWFFYDAEDFHPADGGIQVQAQEIATRLERYEFRKWPSYVPMVSRTRPSEFVVPMDGSGMKKGARYPATAVDFFGGGIFKGREGELPSPIVLMGDSVTLFPANHVDEQNLRAHLARLCGVNLEHLTSMGGSAQAGRLLAREGGDFLAERWVVVFAFAPTRLFGSVSKVSGGKEGWDLVDLPPLKLE